MDKARLSELTACLDRALAAEPSPDTNRAQRVLIELERVEAPSRQHLGATGAGRALNNLAKAKLSGLSARAKSLLDIWRSVASSEKAAAEAKTAPAAGTVQRRPSEQLTPLLSSCPSSAPPPQRCNGREPSARHVCIKVPAPKDEQRRAYERCADREAWVEHQLGTDGRYVGRPKNDGGWYMSPSVKAGSMFANPYPLKEYSLEESVRRFREFVEVRASAQASTDGVIALLPPAVRHLAESRHAGGAEKEAVGRSLAHLRLCVVGPAFREAVRQLRGKRLGCFCDESGLCHAKVLAELAHAFASTDDGGGQAAPPNADPGSSWSGSAVPSARKKRKLEQTE